jgi:hypothetical protein
MPSAAAPTTPASTGGSATATPTQPPPLKPVDTGQPIARKPVDAGPMARPIPRVVEKRAPLPGELVCTNCGTGNEPTRRFCRACGTSLAQAHPAKPLPWYRRLFTRRKKAPLAAGQRTKGTTRSAEGRPRGIRIGFVVSSALSILVLLGVVGYVLVPPFQQVANVLIGDVVDEVRSRVKPNYALIDELSTTASSSQPNQEAKEAFDGGDNTYWSSTEQQPSLHVGFKLDGIPEGKVNVGAVIIQAGVKGKPGEFRTPATIEITSEDTKATVRIDLQPGLEEQSHYFELPDTTAVQIKVTSSREDASLPVAISEIQLFLRD